MQLISAYVEKKDPESGLYAGTVPDITGAHTQAETLDELQRNLREVVELCLAELHPDELAEIPESVGIPQQRS